jgi:hypothetical protein
VNDGLVSAGAATGARGSPIAHGTPLTPAGNCRSLVVVVVVDEVDLRRDCISLPLSTCAVASFVV